MTKKKDRIETSGGDDLSQDNPFASLGGMDLPDPEPKPESRNPKPVTSNPKPETSNPKPVTRKETLLLRRLKAGKGGKVVTEVSGFDANPQQIHDLLKRLQGKLGTGGTCKGKILELQGECRDRLKPLLEAEGYRVKGL